ncbi:MAG: molybdopterin oxidoreductase [Burkholderiales bacterium]|nr:MAG: molybdopterin oxidoreductase [Burkholderiales bacterium]
MKPSFRELPARPSFLWLLGLLAFTVLAGLGAAHHMETAGHVVTGMNNHIVWGLPHVFAVFLIVAASGALNAASLASVFGQEDMKPYARLSGVLALALLAGGLAVLVLDLGRPERLIVAMTNYNFRSIFAWNVFLYTGFFAVVAAYLLAMMDRGLQGYTRLAGWLAFLWRLLLTTGTGSIFGFLLAREALHSALLAPTFIALSFVYGTAVFVLLLLLVEAAGALRLDEAMRSRLARLLAIFVGLALYFVAVLHLTQLYVASRREVEHFVLVDGGLYTALFWLGQVGVGGILPLVLLLKPVTHTRRSRLALASGAMILGGFAQMYVTIIGSQAWPLALFPGQHVASAFEDGRVHTYLPSTPELLLGLGGVALALLLVALALKLLRILPVTGEENS